MANELYCGVDLGGTSAKLALADATGEIIEHDSVSTQEDGTPRSVLPAIADACRQLIDKVSGSNSTLRGIGMGVPGLADVENGITKFLPNLPTQWRDVRVAELLGESLVCPVRLMNDVRTATYGELKFGCGSEQPDLSFAFFSIGTGIGGGVVIDGRVRLGPLGAAGELGHQTILPDGPRCGCGNRGCLETLASGPAIAADGIRLMRMGLAPRLREITDGVSDRVTAETMSQAADQDRPVASAIERAARYIGIGAANVVAILHPDRVVLGGGVAELGERLAGPVREEIRSRVGMFPTDDVTVECSRLGAQAGIRGAVALAMEAAE